MVQTESPSLHLSRRTIIFLVITLITLLLHIFFLSLKLDWFSPESPTQPPIQIDQIDSDKLNQIRDQWRQKLINPEDVLPTPQDIAPDHARFDSQRNQTVEKEQRAMKELTSPILGHPKSLITGDQTQNQDQTGSIPLNKVPSLKNLGIPFRLSPNKTHRKFSPIEGGEYDIQDPTIAEGSENILNTHESVYYSFFNRLYRAIGPVWQKRMRETSPKQNLLPGSYVTVVDVVLDREGNLLSVHHLQNSGISEFDNAVDYAWGKIGKFPNPPPGLLDALNNIHIGWSFTVEVGRGSGFQLLPPERTY